MIFKDEVAIEIKAGKGGRGAASFRREKYIPKGGPDGGDGGNGGSVFINVNPHLRTLSQIHNNQKFRARDGEGGMGSLKHGSDAENIAVEVPIGTLVLDRETGEVLADLTEKDSSFCAAKGGKGGRGNNWFKGPTNQTPFYAQQGLPGEEKKILLELKLIAHVGLVGFPNAGKSTLLSVISVSEFTLNAQEVNAFTFSTLESYLPLALGYLVLTLPISLWSKQLEKKFRYAT